MFDMNKMNLVKVAPFCDDEDVMMEFVDGEHELTVVYSPGDDVTGDLWNFWLEEMDCKRFGDVSWYVWEDGEGGFKPISITRNNISENFIPTDEVTMEIVGVCRRILAECQKVSGAV